MKKSMKWFEKQILTEVNEILLVVKDILIGEISRFLDGQVNYEGKENINAIEWEEHVGLCFRIRHHDDLEIKSNDHAWNILFFFFFSSTLFERTLNRLITSINRIDDCQHFLQITPSVFSLCLDIFVCVCVSPRFFSLRSLFFYFDVCLFVCHSVRRRF